MFVSVLNLTWLATYVAAATAACIIFLPMNPVFAQSIALDREEALDRFWKDSRRTLQDRLGYIVETTSGAGLVTVAVGAVNMSSDDRHRLETAAPDWVVLDLFETQYSLRRLRVFGNRAEEALRKRHMLHLLTGLDVAREPDLLSVLVSRNAPTVEKALSEVLPGGSYEVRVEPAAEFASGRSGGRSEAGATRRPSGVLPVLAVLLALAWLASVWVVRRRLQSR